MKFPDKPTCHGGNEGVFAGLEAKWHEPRGDGDGGPYLETFRRCYYCGSIHPEDLIALLESGATLGGADWKYGWPHKFYVEGIKNPKAGQQCDIGCRSEYVEGKLVVTPIRGAAPATMAAKWYNEHLQDAGFDDEARAKLIALLEKHAGIRFELEGERLKYRAPYKGYQQG